MLENDFTPFMREAIAMAQKSRFRTFPNPSVGAVLVRENHVVARGWHKGAGQPHAEIDCLDNARAQGIDPNGCIMVVTLEPCTHFGKTPPCVDALLEAGIAGLVYGAKDPNPEAAGGAQKMAAAGVTVIGPVLEQECLDLIADFIVWQTTQRPYSILKLAATLDGRIASRNGHSQWISGDSSRKEVHHMRAAIAASGGSILIGGGTLRNDNPALTARLDPEYNGKQPLACILTSRLPKADSDLQLLQQRPEETVFFASPAATASTTAESLRKIGCRVFSLGPAIQGGPDFNKMFTQIRQDLGCPYILCEGGGKLALSLLEAHMVDEFHLHLAPMILGDNEARPLFNGRAPLSLDEALKMRYCNAYIYGNDAHLLLRPLPGGTVKAN